MSAVKQKGYAMKVQVANGEAGIGDEVAYPGSKGQVIAEVTQILVRAETCGRVIATMQVRPVRPRPAYWGQVTIRKMSNVVVLRQAAEG